MRFQGPALAALLISLLLPTLAAADPLDPGILPAFVVSAGRVDSRNTDDGKGNGFFLDGNYTRTFLNGGVSYKNFSGEDVENLYVGVGFSKLLQLQVGYGSEGQVRRLRHDFNLTSIHDFLTGTHRNRYNMSLGNRLTFTVALENYQKDGRFDNFHIGLGLLY